MSQQKLTAIDQDDLSNVREYQMIGRVTKKSDRKITVPAYRTIFRVERNTLQDSPRVEEVLEHTFEYSLMSHNNYNKIKDVTEFTALFHPFMTDVDRYLNLCRLIQYIFILDDHEECLWGDGARTADGSGSIWTQFYSALDLILDKRAEVAVRPVWWKPYITGFYLAIEEICREYAPEQRRRQVQVYRDWAHHNQLEAKLYQEGHGFTDLEELFEIRHKSAGGIVIFQQNEYAYNLHLSDQEYYDPLMTKYLRNGGLLVSLINDIMSFEKELKESDGEISRLMNCVAFLAQKEGIKYEVAMERAVLKYQDYEEETMHLKRQLLARPNNSEDVVNFIEHVDEVIGGNFQGHFFVSRYNNFNTDKVL